MVWSLLLLTTRMPRAAAPAPMEDASPPGPVVDMPARGDAGLPPVVVAPRPVDEAAPRPVDEAAPRPDVPGGGWVFSCPGPFTTRSWSEPGTTWPAPSGWKSSFVMGSLNFFRRNRCSTRTSTLG